MIAVDQHVAAGDGTIRVGEGHVGDDARVLGIDVVEVGLVDAVRLHAVAHAVFFDFDGSAAIACQGAGLFHVEFIDAAQVPKIFFALLAAAFALGGGFHGSPQGKDAWRASTLGLSGPGQKAQGQGHERGLMARTVLLDRWAIAHFAGAALALEFAGAALAFELAGPALALAPAAAALAPAGAAFTAAAAALAAAAPLDGAGRDAFFQLLDLELLHGNPQKGVKRMDVGARANGMPQSW